MSNEFVWDTTPGLTLFAARFQLAGNVFLTDGSGDEVWGTGGRDASDYAVPMVETTPGVSGHYIGHFDAPNNINVTARYKFAYYIQAGGSPADSDLPAIARGEINWDGINFTEIYAGAAGDVVAALMAYTGITQGGVWTYQQLMNVMAAAWTGKRQLKSGETKVYEFLDPDDEATVVFEMTANKTTPYFTFNVLI